MSWFGPEQDDEGAFATQDAPSAGEDVQHEEEEHEEEEAGDDEAGEEPGEAPDEPSEFHDVSREETKERDDWFPADV